MLKKFLFALFFVITNLSMAQHDMPASVYEVIDWKFKVDYKSCDEAIIVMTVHQKDGWHIYSQKHRQPEGFMGGPTELIFTESDDYELVGLAKEYGSELHGGKFPERVFPGDKAVFKQKIKIKAEKDFKVELKYSFIACLEACFPPEFDIPVLIDVKGKGTDCEGVDDDASAQPDNTEENTSETGEVEEGHSDEESTVSRIGFQAFAEKTSDVDYNLVIKPQIAENWILLEDVTIKFNGLLDHSKSLRAPVGIDTVINGKAFKIITDGTFSQHIRIDTSDTLKEVTGEILFAGIDDNGKMFEALPTEFFISIDDAVIKSSDNDTSGNSYWGIFWLAFGGGLFALLTPCVFPMIPMTVSFFTKGSENRRKGLFRGIMYGFFILLIYVLLSVPFHLIDTLNPNILNNIATNGPLNIFFFIMLFVFALSFLGAFEIVLPAKWTNKADSKSNLGGLIGIFFMALTLALVSFSCTGPILGSLLANASAAGGGAWNLTWGMAGFGLALGLPFALFAIFPSWLNSLPSSGGWLNNVKVVLGFLELAFAFKFLSNADLSIQAHLLERELFIAIWIGIFAAMTLYLFGVYQTKHDSPINGGLGTFRVMVGVLSLIFTIYMIPGIFGAPVKLISAFPPPPSYSEIPYGIHGHAPNNLPEGAEYEHGLTVFHDYDVAKKYADEVGKPLMLDFTGLNCVNCRKMENDVWSTEKVHKIMDEDFVIVSLYVDDKVELPAPMTSPYNGQTLYTKGDRWANMEAELYKSSTQPLYVTLDKNGKQMNSVATYKSHKDPAKFEKWLTDAAALYEITTYYSDIKYIAEN